MQVRRKRRKENKNCKENEKRCKVQKQNNYSHEQLYVLRFILCLILCPVCL